jgi:hypothetical protein
MKTRQWDKKGNCLACGFLTELASFRFWAKSALSWPLLQKLKLTSFDTDSGRVNDTKVVDNFNSLLANINTPSCEQGFGSNDL